MHAHTHTHTHKHTCMHMHTYSHTPTNTDYKKKYKTCMCYYPLIRSLKTCLTISPLVLTVRVSNIFYIMCFWADQSQTITIIKYANVNSSCILILANTIVTRASTTYTDVLRIKTIIIYSLLSACVSDVI